MDNFNKVFKKGKISYTLLKYIPDLAKIAYQGELLSTETKRKNANDSYINKKAIEFNVQLTANHYTNFQNLHLCFPLKIKSTADNDSDMKASIITVNNFFPSLY